MTLQEVIQKAIDGGWNPPEEVNKIHKDLGGKLSVHKIIERGFVHQTLLDPNFWRALCIAMGWGAIKGLALPACEGIIKIRTPFWHFCMHQMIDHLADGGTVESYFWQLK